MSEADYFELVQINPKLDKAEICEWREKWLRNKQLTILWTVSKTGKKLVIGPGGTIEYERG